MLQTARARKLLVNVAMLLLNVVSPAIAAELGRTSPDPSLAVQSQPTRRDVPLAPAIESLSGYMCRCTCFGTNSTVVPLPRPGPDSKGGNACSACTKQFCLGLNLDMCQGASTGSADQDTATGFEGDVWARCLQKDSDKDYTVVALYLASIACLITWALVKTHMSSWIEVCSFWQLDSGWGMKLKP